MAITISTGTDRLTKRLRWLGSIRHNPVSMKSSLLDLRGQGGRRELPFGVWRIRSAHYQPQGEFKLTSDGGGCNADFRLTFGTWGTQVIAILPVDSSWTYGSNGRLEREYLDAISAATAQLKPLATPPDKN